jgi:hypothetical protein
VSFTDGVDSGFDAARTRHEHELFLSGQTSSPSLRSTVADSWVRSAAAGLDAEVSTAPITLERDRLADYRAEHPLSRVFPLLYDVLGRAAEDTDSLMAIADADGQLLWVCGQRSLIRRAESINFVEGALWDETHAGTNAPGTALRLDTAVMIHASEHFSRSVQQWSCAAAPIHDPRTQAILGLVDITGGPELASPQTVAMVRAAARMAESELARILAVEDHRTPVSLTTGPHPQLRLAGLGRPDCVAALRGREFRLSPRHSEILVILSRYPNGLSGEQLAAQLYPADASGSTLRAELVRLRALLGEDVLASRPYRLTGEVGSDWSAVAAQLAAGNLGEAMRIYLGPLLPQSDSPGVIEYRHDLQRQLRAAVLASRRPELMVAWTRARWGADDLPMWRGQLEALPVGSPLRPIARAEIAKLDAEFSR